MKIILSFCFCFLLSASIEAQDCNIGNDNTFGFIPGIMSFDPDRFVGVKFYLTAPGELLSLNLIGGNTGGQVQMVLYNSEWDAPKSLIAVSEIGIVDSGLVSLPVTPVSLQAGPYWIMAKYDSQAIHTFHQNQMTEKKVYYSGVVPFGDPPPTDLSGFDFYYDRSVTYFLEIECDELPEPEKELSIFPNPTLDIVNIKNFKDEINSISIYNSIGQLIYNIDHNNEDLEIDLSQIPPGVYSVAVNDDFTERIIKQ